MKYKIEKVENNCREYYIAKYKPTGCFFYKTLVANYTYDTFPLQFATPQVALTTLLEQLELHGIK